MITADRRVFTASNSQDAFVYNLNAFGNGDRELTAETIHLGEGDWQDVCLIGTDKLGFLDREAGVVRVYGIDRTRMADADIEFGIMANWRGIAANTDGTVLYVLVEDLPFLLAWDMDGGEAGTGAFVPAENIPIIPGSVGWQAVALMSNDRIGLVRANSTRVVVLDIETKQRRVEDDIILSR